MSLLATRAVVRRFGDLVAVDSVDISVERGEVVGLLGANGAGKTTLIRLALGLVRPSAGRVALFDEPPSRATRSRLGYVPQGLGLYDDLTVGENLAFARRAFGVGPDRAGRTGRADGTGRSTDRDVAEATGTLVGALPLGLRRRVAFAIALDHDPELLVLDEPTSGVDPLARARLWETIRTAAENGVGALVTTHHMAEAYQCDRLVVLVGGRVAAAGTTAAIVGDTTAVEVMTTAWAAAFGALDAAGLPIALAGSRLRIPGADPVRVRALLDGASIPAQLRVVAATFEEAFVALSTGRAA
jgi:ABC-2 type transport system ATP-binding protein/ribosome-dependent ATPase